MFKKTIPQLQNRQNIVRTAWTYSLFVVEAGTVEGNGGKDSSTQAKTSSDSGQEAGNKRGSKLTWKGRCLDSGPNKEGKQVGHKQGAGQGNKLTFLDVGRQGRLGEISLVKQRQ